MEVSSFRPTEIQSFASNDLSLTKMDEMDIDMDIDLGPVVVTEPEQQVS